jgi:predicted lipoprotein
MKRGAWRRLVGLVAIVLLLIAFPPFHIRRLDSAARELAGEHVAGADVGRLARQFWDTKMASPSLHPTDWRVLVAALRRDPAQGGRPYGHEPAIGGPWFYLLSGEARVVAIDRRGLWLGGPDLGDWRVLLQTGPIFGSALRDGTGLLRLEDFSSFDFNELGARLNRLSEDQVGSVLRREAEVGTRVEFLAAGRLDEVSGDGRTLLLAPIRATLK